MYTALVDNGFEDVISDLVASGVPEVRVGAEGMPLGVGAGVQRNTDGSLAYIQIRPASTVATMSARLAHEVVHAGTGPGSSVYEERRAYGRALGVYTGLGGQGSDYNYDQLLAAKALGQGAFTAAIKARYPSLLWTLR